MQSKGECSLQFPAHFLQLQIVLWPCRLTMQPLAIQPSDDFVLQIGVSYYHGRVQQAVKRKTPTVF
jgi:hypothetical protein